MGSFELPEKKGSGFCTIWKATQANGKDKEQNLFNV